jgi:hypothetical protein
MDVRHWKSDAAERFQNPRFALNVMRTWQDGS